jgi:hypothetical protein
VSFEDSKRKPVFRNEEEVLKVLGQPDTIFYYDDKYKQLLYVTDGGKASTCYNEGMERSLNIVVNDEGKVNSIGSSHY